MTDYEENPQDIDDIVNHKPFLWMFDRKRTMIYHYSKGEWGEIRWDFGFLCGLGLGAPIYLILYTVLTYATG